MSLYRQYQQQKFKNYQNSLAKDLKVQFIGMNIKQIKKNEMRQTAIDIFSKDLTHCFLWFIQTKMSILKCIKLEVIIY